MASQKQTAPKGGSKPSLAANAITDPRFRNIHTDPRFRLPSKKTTHVKLDKRFSHMLRDEDFLKKASVDRYGRPLAKDQGRKELERFYQVDEEDEDDVEVDDDEEVQQELARLDRKYDPARQGGFSESSSDDDSDEEDEEEEDEDAAAGVEGDLGGTEESEVPMGDVSSRIAVVNMDWDNLRAEDIMAVASSFCPPTGRVLKVSIYTSEFGRERMEREEAEGPAPEIFSSKRKATLNGSAKVSKPVMANDDASEDLEDDTNEAVDDDEQIKADLLAQSTADAPEVESKALRNYQLSRLRYYYAVITCDSSDTGSTLYNEMDGREYLSSANFFDLRFIPDSVTFDDPVTDKPRDECERVPDGYRPKEFVTEALRHSKVKLTWDMDDPGRAEVQKRAFSRQEVDENDLMAYVGSDSGEEDAGDDEDDADGGVELNGKKQDSNGAAATTKESKAQAARQKLRAALGLSEDSASSKRSKADKDKPIGGMQVTFTAGLSSEPATNGSIFQNKAEDVKEETTVEKYVRKERERKARRKEKAKDKRGGSDDEDSDNDNDTQAPAKAKANPKSTTKDKPTQPIPSSKTPTTTPAGTDDPFNDPFFTDPTATNASIKKASKASRRAAERAQEEASASRKARERAELELLMAGDGDGAAGVAARGFDMAEIRRAEKRAGKAGKKGKKKREGGEGMGKEEDGFEVDAEDERFKGLFESHEFAIDPSHARFSGTRGMKSLLAAGRKKRRAGDGERDDGGRGDDTVDRRRMKEKRSVEGNDLDDLVNKIKRKRTV